VYVDSEGELLGIFFDIRFEREVEERKSTALRR
jgi:hypothetical protein